MKSRNARGSKQLMYWRRESDRQLQAMKAFCAGKKLLDLGGYDGSLSCRLIEAGAASAINVDKENPLMSAHHHHLTKCNLNFGEFMEANPSGIWQTAILSWPVNNDQTSWQLIPILSRCREVVYLGDNAHSQCGTPILWEYLITRRVRAHIPERACTLIIYGNGMLRTRRLIQEEKNALAANLALEAEKARLMRKPGVLI